MGHQQGVKGLPFSALSSPFVIRSFIYSVLRNFFYVTMLRVEQVSQNIDNKHNRPLATITSFVGRQVDKDRISRQGPHLAAAAEVAQSSAQAHGKRRGLRGKVVRSKRDLRGLKDEDGSEGIPAADI